MPATEPSSEERSVLRHSAAFSEAELVVGYGLPATALVLVSEVAEVGWGLGLAEEAKPHEPALPGYGVPGSGRDMEASCRAAQARSILPSLEERVAYSLAPDNNQMQLTRPAPRQLVGAVLAANPGVRQTSLEGAKTRDPRRKKVSYVVKLWSGSPGAVLGAREGRAKAEIYGTSFGAGRTLPCTWKRCEALLRLGMSCRTARCS